MRLGTPGFVGGRLREAREVRGLTAIVLAEMTGVTRQAISQYETGRSSPSPDVLGSLARVLNMPEPFFTKPERQLDRGTVFFRSMSSATKSARARAEGRFSWLRDIVDYLSEFVAFPKSNFPDLSLPDDPLLLSDDEIETAAEQVRRYWGMTDGPIGNMVHLLENHGAVLARDLLGADTLDGLSEFVAVERRPYIVIGTDKGTPVRWRFDAAHELGHLVLHPRLDRGRLMKSEDFKQVEQQAHRFAAAFLLPLDAFGDDFFAANLDALRSIKPKWKVSIAMMIMRAKQGGFISEETERRLWINYSRRRYRRNEPYDDSMAAEEPKLLRRSVELLLDVGRQTPDDILINLSLPADDVETLSGLPKGYLSGNFAPVALLRQKESPRTDETTTPAEVIDLPLRARTC